METIPWEIEYTQSRIEVRHGCELSIHYGGLNLSQILTVSGNRVSVALLDLAEVAVAAYYADRVCRRGSRSQWSRRIMLRIGVRDPDHWSQDNVTEAVESALGFYTGDQWCLQFLPISHRRPAYSQGDLFRVPIFAPTHVALFSGGLDSLAGVCDELVNSPDERLLLVSGSTSPRMRALQRSLSFELSQRFRGRVAPTVVKFGFRERTPRADRKDETTQRTRGFVFCALGAIAAIATGVCELSIYENGVGSVNLPFTAGQFGVQLTRATNPVALKLMEAVVVALTGEPFHFRLPYLFETKGRLCRSISESGVERLVAQTVSCDGFPQRVAQHPQCGLCTSCLLRRVSLHAADLSAYDAHNYRVDVLRPGWYAPDEKLYPFRAMLYQAELLRLAVNSPMPWRGLVTQFPELIELVNSGVAGNITVAGGRFLDLYRSYCTEWERFPARPSGYEAALAAQGRN